MSDLVRNWLEVWRLTLGYAVRAVSGLCAAVLYMLASGLPSVSSVCFFWFFPSTGFLFCVVGVFLLLLLVGFLVFQCLLFCSCSAAVSYLIRNSCSGGHIGAYDVANRQSNGGRICFFFFLQMFYFRKCCLGRLCYV